MCDDFLKLFYGIDIFNVGFQLKIYFQCSKYHLRRIN